MRFGAFGQAEEPAQDAAISTPALARLLVRLGYYGEVVDAFDRWGQENLPAAMRPYGISSNEVTSYINPPEALDALLEQSRARESPWKTLFWGTLTAAIGAVVYVVVQKRIG